MALINCKECAKQVSDQAPACPHCGAPVKASKTKKTSSGCLVLFGLLFLLFVIGSILSGVDRESSKSSSSPPLGSPSPPVAKPQKPPLELLSWSCSNEHSYIFVQGEVKNVSSQPLKNILAVGVFRTNDGTFVKSADALIDYNPILPEQVSPFKAGSTENPAITSCGINFKTLFGETVAYTDKSKKN